MILIALLVKLESKGPIFYISKRAGAGYKIFNFYKFRSMRVGADDELKKLAHLNQYSENNENGVFFKIKNDPRVTKVGNFIRNTSLDELPQLINVLIGDMSLVGNRPLPLYEAEKLTKDQIAWRFLAPAGITGLWQVTKRGKDNMSPEERIALDMEYAMKNSFWLDMKILLSTIPALLQKEKV
jgi:lipopolysaccharide/colanic/teichoic acid biosynthesis glycosyltransferase